LGPPEEVAPRLLGWRLRTTIDGAVTELEIVEVEAYGPDDPASHSYRGRTERNRSMFLGPGILYVYRSYGVHWCANVVVGPEDTGAAVLLRGGLPTVGRREMERRRGRPDHICDGPGRLCQALGITGREDGTDLLSPGRPVRLIPSPDPVPFESTIRIGISHGADRRWRFVATR
jgi:DNA-3-methyladenine glycosylase